MQSESTNIHCRVAEQMWFVNIGIRRKELGTVMLAVLFIYLLNYIELPGQRSVVSDCQQLLLLGHA